MVQIEQMIKKRKPLGFLKDIDLFSSPVRTYFHRHSSETKITKHQINMGTYIGGICSIGFIACIIFRIIKLWIMMENGQKDNIQQLDITNMFESQFSSINVGNSSFMPYFIIENPSSTSNFSDFDIWDDSNTTLNISRLSNYFEPVVIYRERHPKKKDITIIKPMKPCTADDFKKRGSFNTLLDFSQRDKFVICPDFEDDYMDFVLENRYLSEERKSFSLQIIACSPLRNKHCKNQDEVKSIFGSFMFTVYNLVQRIEFFSQNSEERERILTHNHFKEQFQLSSQEYRDNNNFIRINWVEITESGFGFSDDSSITKKFYDQLSNPVWIGQPIVNYEMASRDGGRTFNMENIQEFWGSFYFMSDDAKMHYRTIYGYSDLLTDIGGLFEIVFFILMMVLTPLNNMRFFNKAIRSVYFNEHIQDRRSSVSYLKPVKFNMKHALTKWCWGICDKLKPADNQLYKQGECKIKHDLNLLRMIQNIYKIKASLIVLMKKLGVENDETVQQIQKRYLHLVSLKYEEKPSKDEFAQFLERDEKNIFYDKIFMLKTKKNAPEKRKSVVILPYSREGLRTQSIRKIKTSDKSTNGGPNYKDDSFKTDDSALSITQNNIEDQKIQKLEAQIIVSHQQDDSRS